MHPHLLLLLLRNLHSDLRLLLLLLLLTWLRHSHRLLHLVSRLLHPHSRLLLLHSHLRILLLLLHSDLLLELLLPELLLL